MGAHSFTDLAHAKTPADAYRAAVARAGHEYGHNPYNGTISTTSGYVMIPLAQKRFTKAALRRWEEKILDDPRVEKWERCACVELPPSHPWTKGRPRGTRTFLFAGWAAS